MKKSGAVLREVGTTNRTFVEDYERAIGEGTGLIMKAHTSNYRIKGFVHEATSEELVAAFAPSRQIPFFFDAGSGLLSPSGTLARFAEPLVAEEAEKGHRSISFSGDKLLGGPQAGVILGPEAVHRRHENATPLREHLRPDKFTLAALEATLLLYLDEDKAKREVPTLADARCG